MRGWFRRHWRALLAAGLPVVLLVALGIDVAVRYVPAVRALADGRTAAIQAEQLLHSDPAHLDRARVGRATTLLRRASADLGAGSAIVESGWLAGAASHLPAVGDQVRVARALRRTGIAGTRLGLDVTTLLSDLLPDTGAPAPGLARVVTTATRELPLLHRTAADAAALSAAAATVPAAHVPGPLGRTQTTIARDVPRVVGVVKPLSDVLGTLPSAAGPGRHTYLLLLGNSAEERPGGGFIGAIGELSVTEGAITSVRFRMSDFANRLVTSIPAPTALNDYLFHGHPWDLADANWSPDFPTSAAEVRHFYRLATGDEVDGVLSVDPTALSDVLDVLGPVQVPPYPQTISAANALHEINEIINRARPGDPGPSYLAPLGQTVLGRVLHAPVQDYPRLASALGQAVAGRHIVMSFDDPDVQAVVAAYHADGSLSSTGGDDGVLVADANLSGSKADLLVSRSFGLTVHLDSDGAAHDRLTLSYHDARPGNAADASLVRGSGGAYRDYVRAYLPAGTRLDTMRLTADGRTVTVSPGEISQEDGRLAVGFYLIVPSGGDRSLEVDYEGSFAHRHGAALDYRLTWTKQVQALPWPVRLLVTWPDGRRDSFTATLDRDRCWSLTG